LPVSLAWLAWLAWLTWLAWLAADCTLHKIRNRATVQVPCMILSW